MLRNRSMEEAAIVVMAAVLAISMASNLLFLVSTYNSIGSKEREREETYRKYCPPSNGVDWRIPSPKANADAGDNSEQERVQHCQMIRQTLAAERSADSAGMQNILGYLGFIFVVVATFAALNAARYTQKQAETSNLALIEARDAFAEEHRAWLSIPMVIVHEISRNTGGQLMPHVRIRAINLGTTPATNVRQFVDFIGTTKFPHSDIIAIMDTHGKSIIEDGATVFQNQSITTEVVLPIPDDLRDRAQIVMVCSVVYRPNPRLGFRQTSRVFSVGMTPINGFDEDGAVVQFPVTIRNFLQTIVVT